MFRNTIIALIVALGLFATASFADTTTNNVPANTITIRATIDEMDIVTIRGDRLWITHIKGELPTGIQVNNNPWTPDWEVDREESNAPPPVAQSDTFAMKKPSRFLPMNNRRGIISVGTSEGNVKATVLEFPEAFNEWMLIISLVNKGNEPAQVDLTISWENDPMPIVLPSSVVPHTKPDPTPTGLR